MMKVIKSVENRNRLMTIFLFVFLSSVLVGQDNCPESTSNLSKVVFTLDECTSFFDDGSNTDYSEFVAITGDNSECSDMTLVGRSLYRVNATENGHSCTPGFDGQEGMCVSASSSCSFENMSEQAIRIDLELTPGQGSAQLKEFKFYEKGPEEYVWIDGKRGANNYPEFYGVRITANGQEVYKRTDIPTGKEWSLQTLDLSQIDGFTVDQPTIFSFELLAYCPVDNGGDVSIWDVDQIEVYAGCETMINGGMLTTSDGTTTVDLCTGDAVSINFTPRLEFATGENQVWIVTDSDNNILSQLTGPTFDLKDFGGGSCRLYNVSYDGDISGLNVGNNISNISGCFDLSNAIDINKKLIDGGTIDFNITSGGCGNTDETILQLSTDDLPAGVSGDDNRWEIRQGANVTMGEGNPYSFTLTNNEPLEITLTNDTANGCNLVSQKVFDPSVDSSTDPRFRFDVQDCNETNVDATFISEYDNLGGVPVISHDWVFFMNNNSFEMSGKSVNVQIPTRFNLMVRLKLTLENGCSFSVTESVDFGDVPSVKTFSNPIYVCNNDEISIVTNPNNDWLYTWLPETGLTFTTNSKSNPTFVGTRSQKYQVTVISPLCLVEDEIEVIVLEDIIIDVVGDIENCTPRGTLSINNPVNITYEWATDENFENSLGEGTQISYNFTGQTDANIYVRATAPNGCVSKTQKVDIKITEGIDLIFIDGGDGIVEICEGEGGMIILNSNPDWNYEWSPMTGITGDLSNPKVNPTERTTYSVTVTSGDCQMTRDIEVVPGDTYEIGIQGLDADGNVNTCASNVTLKVVGLCEPNYQWSLDQSFSQIISTNATLQVDASGTYYVRGVLSGCTSEVEEIEVTLGDGPSIEFTDDGDGIIQVCEGIGGMIVKNPNPAWKYIWSPTTNLSGDLFSPKVNPTEATTYSVTVTDGDCEAFGEVRVVPSNQLDISVVGLDMDGQVNTCASGKILMAVGNCDPNYEWSDDSSFSNILATGPRFSVIENGSYFVRAMLNDDCQSEVEMIDVTLGDGPFIEFTDGGDGIVDVCSATGGAIVLNPNPAWTYTWSPMIGVTGDLSNPKVNPTEPTIYTVTVTDGNCESVGEVLVNPGNNHEIEIIGKTSEGEIAACGGSTTLTVTGNCEPQYEWSDTPSFNNILSRSDMLEVNNSGTYYVRAVLEGSCISEVEEIDVTLGDSDLTIDFMAGDDDVIELCDGVGAMIVMNPNPNFTYTWSPMDGISGDLSNPLVNPDGTTVYTVTVSNGSCEVTNQIEVRPTNVSEVDIVGLDGDNKVGICDSNSELMVMGNAQGTYEWATDDAFSNIIGTTDKLTVSSEGFYYVRAVFTAGCESEILEFEVVFGNDNLSIDFMGGEDGIVELCENVGGMIVTNPNPDWIYTWSPMDGISGDLFNPVVAPNSATIYTVTVSDGACEIVEMIEVVPGGRTEIEVLDLDVDDRIVDCTSEAVVTVMGNAEGTYEWSSDPDFGSILGTESTITITDAGVYFVRAVTSTNCESEVIQFEVVLGEGDEDVSIDFVDDDGDGQVSICEGVGGMIVTNPNPEWTYTWTPMDGISGELSNPKFNPSETTTYDVTVSNGACEVTESITVVPGNMMEISVSGVDSEGKLDVCGGSKTVTASGNCEPNYEWSRTVDFAEIISTQDYYNITEVGTYYLRAVTGDENCISEVEEIEAILGDGPSLEFTDGGDGIVEVCEGIGGMIIANPNPEWTYTWSPMDGIEGDLSNPKVNPTEPTTYSVTVTDGVCETDGMVQVVPGDSLEIAVQGADSEGRILVCNGETITLTARGNCEDNYEWSINENFDPIISTTSVLTTQVTLGEEYFVRAIIEGCNSETEKITISDISGEFQIPEGTEICPGDTLTFAVEAVNNPDSILISWDADDHIISDLEGEEITIVSFEGDGDITLSFTKMSADSSCVAMDSITVPMGMDMDNLNVSLDIDCATFEVCFETDAMDGDLLWDFGDDSTEDDVSTDGSPCYIYPGPGEYVAVVKGETSCSIPELSVPVLISDAVSITTMSDTISFCEGEELTLSANSEIPQNIYWSYMTGDTLGTGPSIMLTPGSDTTVFAIVTDGETCRDSVSIFLDGYFFEVEVMAPDAVCPGEELSIEAINTGTDSLTYLWGPEECIISGGDTPTPQVMVELSKDLFLTVTNPANGCVKEFTVPLTISELDLEVTADPESTINRGESVDITAASEGDSLQWAWSNGETIETIIVQPEETTVYNVQVTDANGCEADGTITITVIQPVCDSSDVYIPTAFSPNGDGVNDEFLVRSNFIKDMQLDIYNRWGEVVFNTANQRTGWNGMFENSGEDLHSDTYAYCLKVTCTNDLSYTMLGNVTLVR